MKRAIALLLLAGATYCAADTGFRSPSVIVREADGSPRRGVQEIVFPNGSLSGSGTAMAFSGAGNIVEIPISGASLKGTVTNGAGDASLLSESAETSSNKVNHDFFRFPSDSTKYAYFDYSLPPGFDGTNLKFRVTWTSVAGVSGTSATFCLQGVSYSDGDSIDTAYGSAVCVDADMTATDKVLISPISSNITLGNSWSPGDHVKWRIYRYTDDADDTLASDALLEEIRIRYTRSSATD